MVDADLNLNEDKIKKSRFNKWLSEPLTKVVLSTMLSTTDNQALIELLKSAFNSGFINGQSNMAVSFFKAMLDKPKSHR